MTKKYNEDDIAPLIFLLRSNLHLDDEKEEREILEEDCGVAHKGMLKKKVDSDVEHGEIKLDELVDRLDNRDQVCLAKPLYPVSFCKFYLLSVSKYPMSLV